MSLKLSNFVIPTHPLGENHCDRIALRQNAIVRIVFWLALALVCPAVTITAQTIPFAYSTVQIEMLDRPIYTRNTIIRVQDIATIKGGSEQLQRKIASLDVEQFDRTGLQTQYNSKQLYYRIRLAKIADDSFEITGPETIDIFTVDPQAIAETITARCRYALAMYWKVPEATIQFSVLPSHIKSLLSTQCHPDQCQWAIRYPEAPISNQLQRLDVELTTPSAKTVKLTLPFNWTSDAVDATSVVQPVHYQVAEPLQSTAEVSTIRSEAAQRPGFAFSSEATIAHANSVIDGQYKPVDLANSQPGPSRLIGDQQLMPPETNASLDRAALPLPLPAALPTNSSTNVSRRAGQQSGQSSGEMVIRNNQTVTLIVNSGPVTLKLRNGQALQKGAVGDVIEVRNPKNPRVKLWGRILDGQTVEIVN